MRSEGAVAARVLGASRLLFGVTHVSETLSLFEPDHV